MIWMLRISLIEFPLSRWLRLERPDRDTFRLCLNASESLKRQVTIEDLDLLSWDPSNERLIADPDGIPYNYERSEKGASSSSPQSPAPPSSCLSASRESNSNESNGGATATASLQKGNEAASADALACAIDSVVGRCVLEPVEKHRKALLQGFAFILQRILDNPGIPKFRKVRNATVDRLLWPLSFTFFFFFFLSYSGAHSHEIPM
jgi:hypothetical protein